LHSQLSGIPQPMQLPLLSCNYSTPCECKVRNGIEERDIPARRHHDSSPSEVPLLLQPDAGGPSRAIAALLLIAWRQGRSEGAGGLISLTLPPTTPMSPPSWTGR